MHVTGLSIRLRVANRVSKCSILSYKMIAHNKSKRVGHTPSKACSLGKIKLYG